jgi:peptidoglycan/LPS O-acetylase OafA/YrhL
MYLLNTLVVKAARPAMAPLHIIHPLAMFPITTAGTVLLAHLSYRYFESWFLRLKDKFTRVPKPAGVEMAGEPPREVAPENVVSVTTYQVASRGARVPQRSSGI